MKALSDTDTTLHTDVFSEDDEAIIVSASNPALPSLPTVGGMRLRFASGEAVASHGVPVSRLRKRARRRACSDLFDLAVVTLMIVCAAACIYRLSWAMQP